MKRAFVAAAIIVMAVFVTGCGGGTGSLTGTLTGAGSPLPDVQIILCETAGANAPEHLLCTLKGAPTTTTGPDGSFELSGVPAGSYVVMYGLPGQLALTPEEWDGIAVTRGNFCMEGMRNSVCDIEGAKPSLFWSEGALRVGDEVVAMAYQDFEEQPGVVILATAAEGSAAEHMHIFIGTVQSIYAGITANISAGQYGPQVEVTGGGSSQVDIEVPFE